MDTWAVKRPECKEEKRLSRKMMALDYLKLSEKKRKRKEKRKEEKKKERDCPGLPLPNIDLSLMPQLLWGGGEAGGSSETPVDLF